MQLMLRAKMLLRVHERHGLIVTTRAETLSFSLMMRISRQRSSSSGACC